MLDLLVATVSGVAAAYALCRTSVSAALPGVAIAVALVPPLATVGLFLGIRDPALAYGALLLFLTNLAGITVASGVVFTLFGFRPPFVEEKDLHRIKLFQRSFLAAGLLLLIVFASLILISLAISLLPHLTALSDRLTAHRPALAVPESEQDLQSSAKDDELIAAIATALTMEFEGEVLMEDQKITIAIGPKAYSPWGSAGMMRTTSRRSSNA